MEEENRWSSKHCSSFHFQCDICLSDLMLLRDVTEGLTAERFSTRPSTCVFRRRWRIQRQTRQKIQVGRRGVTNSVSEAKNTEVCVWVWVKVRQKVLQEGKWSLLQISSLCSLIFLTLVYVICRGGHSTNVSKSEWGGSFCKKEAGPTWKVLVLVLVEKTGTGESSDGAEPF